MQKGAGGGNNSQCILLFTAVEIILVEVFKECPQACPAQEHPMAKRGLWKPSAGFSDIFAHTVDRTTELLTFRFQPQSHHLAALHTTAGGTMPMEEFSLTVVLRATSRKRMPVLGSIPGAS